MQVFIWEVISGSTVGRMRQSDEKQLKGCITEVTAIGNRGLILHLFSPLNYKNVKVTLGQG